MLWTAAEVTWLPTALADKTRFLVRVTKNEKFFKEKCFRLVRWSRMSLTNTNKAWQISRISTYSGRPAVVGNMTSLPSVTNWCRISAQALTLYRKKTLQKKVVFTAMKFTALSIHILLHLVEKLALLGNLFCLTTPGGCIIVLTLTDCLVPFCTLFLIIEYNTVLFRNYFFYFFITTTIMLACYQDYFLYSDCACTQIYFHFAFTRCCFLLISQLIFSLFT